MKKDFINIFTFPYFYASDFIQNPQNIPEMEKTPKAEMPEAEVYKPHT